VAVGVGEVAAQPLEARGLVVDQRRRAHSHLHARRREDAERALGDGDLAERGRVHVVGHDQVAGAEVREVQDQVGRGPDHRVRLAHARRVARAAEVERDGDGQHAVAVLADRAQRLAVAGRERIAVPVRAADVVDADVQAAEVVARVRTGGGRAPRRQLALRHVAQHRAVLGVAAVGQAEAARRPQRPRLERHAPLQLAAGVGDRVAEGENALAAWVAQGRIRNRSYASGESPAGDESRTVAR